MSKNARYEFVIGAQAFIAVATVKFFMFDAGMTFCPRPARKRPFRYSAQS